MTYKIKNQEKAITHEWGDYEVYGDDDKNMFIRNFKKSDIDGKNVLFLGYVHPNHWKAIGDIKVFDHQQLLEIAKNSKYQCEYTDRDYVSLVPLAIFSDNVGKYFGEHHPWYRDMAVDKDWNLRDGYGGFEDVRDYMSNIDRTMLGSGYAEGFITNDGDYSYQPVLMDIEGTDDVLYCVCLCWHNK